MCLLKIVLADVVSVENLFSNPFINAGFKKNGIDARYLTLRCKKNRIHGVAGMSKYEIIDCIMEINKTARQEFLDQFSMEDLDLYLEHLMEVDLEEIALCA